MLQNTKYETKMKEHLYYFTSDYPEQSAVLYITYSTENLDLDWMREVKEKLGREICTTLSSRTANFQVTKSRGCGGGARPKSLVKN